MWHGNPVLTAVLFGLPLGFLSLICHSICCADIMDADDDEEEGIQIHIFCTIRKSIMNVSRFSLMSWPGNLNSMWESYITGH
jgi:hypothetical protein